MHIIVATFVVSLVLAGILGFLLGAFKKLFHIDVDPAEQSVRAALPGANCGACGYPGCDALASAIASGDAGAASCTVGGASVAKAIGAIMGVDGKAENQVAVLLCQGTHASCAPKARYNGVKTCVAAKLAVNGTKRCDWSCIGFGDCARACPFGAIRMADNGLPVVDYRKCTGCGICVSECPQKVFVRIPSARTGAVALCSNRNAKKAQVIKDCKAGCIKCGKCETVCHASCIKVTDGIPVVTYALCDSCGECVKNCPTKVLALLEHTVKAV